MSSPCARDGQAKSSPYLQVHKYLTNTTGNGIVKSGSPNSLLLICSPTLTLEHGCSLPWILPLFFRGCNARHSVALQLLHIDVDGCMRIIQKRKSRQLELLKAVAGNAGGTSQVGALWCLPPLSSPAPCAQRASRLLPAVDHSSPACGGGGCLVWKEAGELKLQSVSLRWRVQCPPPHVCMHTATSTASQR